MTTFFDLITDHTQDCLLEETSTLIGMLDKSGNILEGNKSLQDFLSQDMEDNCLFSFLAEASQEELSSMMRCMESGGECQRLVLEFSTASHNQATYEAIIKLIPDNSFFFIAEPSLAINRSIAEDYLQKTQQFAKITQELQQTRHELAFKQQDYEVILDELKHTAIVDGLTGVLNRRKLMLDLETEAERALRYKTPLTVLMIDLDHFKAVNDRFGHQVGDIVLKTVGGVMASALRKVDIIGRYGGEEFMILLPQTDLEPAKILAERLRLQIEDIVIETDSIDKLSITASIGIAVLDHDKDDADSLVNRADKALYWAKDTGRNRSVAL